MVKAGIKGGEISLRAFQDDDRSFLFSSWLNSYRSSSANIGFDVGDYYTRQEQIIAYILARPNTVVLVACDEELPDVLYGWICIELPAIIHYVYVKQSFRRLGIASQLLASLPAGTKNIVASHLPANADLIRKMKEKGIRYEPTYAA